MRSVIAFLTAMSIAGGCGVTIHDAVMREDTDLALALIAEDASRLHATNSWTKAKGKTPLHYAVTYGAEELVDVLTDIGADVNAADDTGMTPLHVAAMIDRRAEAATLIGRGANIEARDHFGDTPAHTAAIHGQWRMVDLLAKYDADLWATNDDGLTPLELAERYRQERVVDYLEHARDYDD